MTRRQIIRTIRKLHPTLTRVSFRFTPTKELMSILESLERARRVGKVAGDFSLNISSTKKN